MKQSAAVHLSPEETEAAAGPLSKLKRPAEAPPEVVEQSDEQLSRRGRAQATGTHLHPASRTGRASGRSGGTPEPEPEPPANEVAAPEPTLAVAAGPFPTSQAKNAPSATEQPGLADSQKEGLIFRDCDACPELVSIAPGEFMVGPEGRSTAQQAITAVVATKVVVDKPFAIGRYEITFDDWQHCVERGAARANQPMMAGDADAVP